MNDRLKVLCVDDNADAADTTARLLELAGCEVRACHDPASALTAADAFRPDVCVIDLTMPGMNGDELALRLKERAGDRAVRCVALTGRWDVAAQHQTHNAGFEAHLVKPADPQQLIAVVTGRPQAPPV